MTFEGNMFGGFTFLVTGASGYLGRQITNQINQLSGSVLMIDRELALLEEVNANLITMYPNVSNTIFQCDLEFDQECEALVNFVNSKYGKLDCLINCAAYVGSSSLTGWSVEFEKQDINIWRKAINVNLTAVFYLCQKLAPLLNKSEFGNIINVASIYGMLGPDWDLYLGTRMSNPAAYAASKGGIIQLTKWLATTLAPNVRVNCVSPGGLFRNQDNSFVQKYIKKTPLRRMGTEKEVASVVAFLASDMASYITGQNIIVDGGFSVW